MAGANQVSVGTTPTLLVSAPVVGAGGGPGPVGWFALANGTTATVYLNGGTQVSSTNGYLLDTNNGSLTSSTLTGNLYSGDNIYGITASGSATVYVIQTGV